MKTTIEWFDPKDAMPKGVDKVLAVTKTSGISDLYYSNKHKAFNATDDEETPKFPLNIKYWAYIPEELKR